MAFETAEIRSTLDAITPINGFRQDAVVGNLVGLSLTNLVGTPSTFKWELIGRPAFSVAGGAGINPWLLSTSSTASFTVDGDAVARRDGSYIVRCTLNEGAPTQRVIEAAICRVSGETITGPSGAVALRKMGAFETLLDTFSVSPANLGWAPQFEHWLEALRVLIAAGPPGGSGTLNATYLAGAVAADQTLDLMDADGGAFIVDGTDAGFTGAFALIAKHDAQTAFLAEAASGELTRAIATTNLTTGYSSWFVNDQAGVDNESGRVGSWIITGEGPTLDDTGLEVRSESELRLNTNGTTLTGRLSAVALERILKMGNSTILSGGEFATADPYVIINNKSLARPTGGGAFLPALNVASNLTVNNPGNGFSWRSIFVGDPSAVELVFTGTGNPNIVGLEYIRISGPDIRATGGNTFTAGFAATLYLASAPTQGADVTLTKKYTLFVDSGLVRFDGDGTDVFEVPNDVGAVGATFGRIPIQVTGVGQKFIEVFN